MGEGASAAPATDDHLDRVQSAECRVLHPYYRTALRATIVPQPFNAAVVAAVTELASKAPKAQSPKSSKLKAQSSTLRVEQKMDFVASYEF
ncbi:hypothetical protein J1614_007051 [Plenodomus biglobosus]|nr:hypothetical protein J1614_007051 [Plenodomus biglobosus]